jgi:hypothetical protein
MVEHDDTTWIRNSSYHYFDLHDVSLQSILKNHHKCARLSGPEITCRPYHEKCDCRYSMCLTSHGAPAGPCFLPRNSTWVIVRHPSKAKSSFGPLESQELGFPKSMCPCRHSCEKVWVDTAWYFPTGLFFGIL